MDIRVFSREKIKYFATDQKHVVISVRDPGSEPAILRPSNTRQDVLYLEFDDIDSKSFPGEVLFDNVMAQKVWDFVHRYAHEIELIAVNCEAGIARSSAIAGAISRVLNGTDDKFFRVPYYPNRLVYRTLLNLYMNGG